MALTKEDLQAIGSLIDKKLEPINKKLDDHIEQSKQASIRAAKQREADKKEIMAYTDESVKKLKAKFK